MKTLSLLKAGFILHSKLLFFWMLSFFITEHSKRSIFLTFIFMRLKDVNEFDVNSFSRLNEICGLVSCVDALKMPALLIEHFFNKEVGRCNTLATCDFKSYAKEVLSKVPNWLRYDESKMRKDLLDVVKYCNNKEICVSR